MPRNNNMPSFGGNTTTYEDPFGLPPIGGATFEDPFKMPESPQFGAPQAANVDPWAAPSSLNFDPSTSSVAAAGNVDPFAVPGAASANTDPWATPSADTLQSMYDAPAFAPSHEVGNEKRETLLSKIKRKFGGVAVRLSGMIRGVDVAGTFGAGGRVSQGIDTASSVVDRADKIANSRTAKVASHIPIVGNYVKAGRELVGAAQSVTEIAGHYDNVAQGAVDAYGNRDQLGGAAVEYGKAAGKRVAVESAGAAASHILESAGITHEVDANGEKTRKIRVGKMARFAVKAVRTGGGSLVQTGAEGMRVGLDAAKAGVNAEVAAAASNLKEQADTVYETGTSDWFAQSAW